MENIIKTFGQEKINYLQVLMISIGLGLGFDLVSFLPEYVTVDSQIVTICFRGLYFFICLYVIHKCYKKKYLTKSYLPLIIFFIFYIIRSIFDSFYDYKNIYFFLLEFWIFVIMLIIIPILSFSCSINYKTLNRAKLFTLYLAISTNLLGVFNNIINLEGFKGGRLTSNLLMNPVSFGQMGVILVAICITYLIKSNIINNLILFSLIILGIFNIALAGSRGPLIELVLVLVLFIFSNFKKFNKIYFFSILLLLFFIFIYYSQYFLYFDTALARLEGSGQEERNLLINDALDKIINNPILGFQAIGSYPHNLLIESLMAFGLLGGILMIYLYYQSIKCILFLVRNENTSWLALILLMHMFATLISGAIYNSIEFWPLLSLCIYLYKSLHLSKNPRNYRYD